MDNAGKLNDSGQSNSTGTGQSRILSLLQAMLASHQNDLNDGIDCATCCDKMDCLCELIAAGTDREKALPAVYAHIECCRDCREEFEALLAVILAEQAGKF